ncbi:LysM peptidoglycan-binding domain-containing protein [Polymorphobacter multimanifer]|nr:LysM peptidoglycan-binding domain-containing protein [Polymorphobacter multimanifer]
MIDFFKDKLGIGGPDADKIKGQVEKLGLDVQNLDIKIDDGIATVTGLAANRAEASKIVMAIGNNEGIIKVDNKMRVPLSSITPKAAASATTPSPTPAPTAAQDADADEEAVVFYPVAKGDTLSAIAKRLYGNANLYPKIFEANRPMLSHPDKIYPGQVLRVPPLDTSV